MNWVDVAIQQGFHQIRNWRNVSPFMPQTAKELKYSIRILEDGLNEKLWSPWMLWEPIYSYFIMEDAKPKPEPEPEPSSSPFLSPLPPSPPSSSSASVLSPSAAAAAAAVAAAAAAAAAEMKEMKEMKAPCFEQNLLKGLLLELQMQC